MGFRRRWLGSLVGASVALATNLASASPSARLVYVRNAETESCPDETAVRAAVSARLGYDPFFPNAGETMFIELSKEKGGYRARVKLVDAQNNVRGTRELVEKGRSCSAMIDTLALSISIAIDPDSLTRAPASPSAKTEEVSPPAEPPLPPAKPATPAPAEPPAASPPIAPSPSRSPKIELLALPAAWIGTGPPAAFGAELGARLRWTRVSIGLEARGDLPASRTVRDVDVEMKFFGGSLLGCGHVSAFFACARGTLGSISATSNASAPRDASALRFLLGASVGVEIPLGETLHLLGRLNGNVALDQQTVVLNDADAFEVSRFSGGLEAGALVRF